MRPRVVTGTGAGVAVGAATATFDLTLDAAAAASLSVTVTVTTGTYNTAASLQSDLQTKIDTRRTGQAGFTGAVTVSVHDLGSGAWSVELVRNTTDSTGKLTFANVGAGVKGVTAGTSSTTTSTGGVFQVGANVTSTDQITLSISDMRITNGTVGAFTALSSIDVTDTVGVRIGAAGDRRRDHGGLRRPWLPRCGPEPLREHHQQPAGDDREPLGVRVPHP